MKELNSQVCTSIEQSKRLLALGLKPETADCTLAILNGALVSFIGQTKIDCSKITINGNEIEKKEIVHIPAWSLHRLIELLPENIHLDDYDDTHYYLTIDPTKVIYKNSHRLWIYQCDEGDLYDSLISTIEWTIRHNYFNKEYLKQ